MKYLNQIVLIALVVFTTKVLAQQEVPTRGRKMLGPFPEKTFSLNDNNRAAFTSKKVNDTTVLTLETKEPADNAWDLQISSRSKFPVNRGDVMLIAFDGRMVSSTDETGKAMVNVVFERASPEWDKSIFQNVALTSEWTTYYLPFKAANTFAPGEAQMNFQIGFKPQKLEIKNFQFLNYQSARKLEELPKTKYTYDGREADAEWRQQAKENIEKYRKADINISITDKKGNPKEGVTVDINMTKHAFGWGTAIDATTFNLRDKYREIVKNNFNKVVFENDLKWPQWENPLNREQMFQALEWFNNNNIDVRGHVMVWPSWRWLPYHVKQKENEPEKLQQHVLNHIQEEGEALVGKIAEWDVLNEPFTNTDLMRICGDEAMIEWFEKMKEVDGKPIRYINDFSIIGGGGTDAAHQNHYYKTIKYLVDNNAPVQGIGFQSHFGTHLTAPTKIWSILDRYKEFGLEMQVTEFDVDVDDEELQADYTRDFMTAIFAYPKMTGLLTWGFWESRHWRPKCAMYKSDWTPKQSATLWHDLIYKTWWTSESLSLTNGKAAVRGFKGEYTYTIKNKNGTVLKEGTFTLGDDGFDLALNVK